VRESVGRSGSRRDVILAEKIRRAGGRGIGANVEVEDSRRGTRGQLVGGTVEVQVDEFFEALRKFKIRAPRKRLSYVQNDT